MVLPEEMWAQRILDAGDGGNPNSDYGGKRLPKAISLQGRQEQVETEGAFTTRR